MTIKIKNIIFSFLILLSFFKSYTYHKPSIENNERIIKSLYEKKTELPILNPKAKALYMQILKENKIILKHIIANETTLFNLEIITGIIGLWFGVPWFFKSIQPFLFIYALSHNVISLEGIQTPLGTRCFALFIGAIFATVSLWIIKLSINNLYRGWYKKEKVIQDLAKTNELLILLSSI